MKKLSKYLIVIAISLFGFIFGVDAKLTLGEEFSFGNESYSIPSYYGKPTFIGAGRNYHVDMYYAKEYKNYKYGVLCLDPGKSTPKNLYVYRMLMDSSQYYAEDYGILNVVAFDGSDITSPAMQDQLFVDDFAVRLLVNGVYDGWQNIMVNQERRDDLANAAQYIVNNEYCNFDGESKAYNSQYPYISKNKYINPPLEFKIGTSGIGFGTARLRDEVVNKFCKGYIAYKNYDAGKEKIPVVNGDVFPKDGGNGTMYFIASFEIKDFFIDAKDDITPGELVELSSVTNGTYSINFGPLDTIINGEDEIFEVLGASFSFNSNDVEGFYTTAESTALLAEIYNGSNNKNALTSPKLAAKLLEGEGSKKWNTKVYIALKATNYTFSGGSIASTKFHYSYKHPNTLTGALLKADQEGFDISAYQRFITYGYDGASKDIKINPAEKGCEPTFLPGVCKDGDTPDTNGNVTYAFREAYFSESTGEEIKRCVVNKKDVAKNSYKYSNGNYAAAVVGNPYCSVFCKEDYVFDLPYKRTVENGRYFKIGVNVAAKQTCYSSQINETLMLDDIKKANNDLIDAYNKWAFYDSMVNGKLEFGCSTDTDTNGKKYEYPYNVCTYETSTPDKCDECIIKHEDQPFLDEHGEFSYDPDCTCPAVKTTVVSKYTRTKYYNQIKFIHDFYDYNGSKIGFTKTAVFGAVVGKAVIEDDDTDTYGVNNTNNGRYSLYRLGDPDIVHYQPKEPLVSLEITDKDTTDISVCFGGDLHENGEAGYTKLSTNAKTGEVKECTYTVQGNVSEASKNKTDYSKIYTTVIFTSPEEDYKSLKELYEKNLAVAESQLAAASKKIDKIINLYNSCSGFNQSTKVTSASWNTPFKFDPEVSYSYDEPNVKGYPENQKWINQVKAKTCENNKNCTVLQPVKDSVKIYSQTSDPDIKVGAYFTKAKSTETGINYIPNIDYTSAASLLTDSANQLPYKSYCLGNVKEDYTCEGTSFKEGAGSSTEQYRDIQVSYFDVDKKKFDKKTYYISNVKYVTTYSSAIGSYDTPQVFYTTTPSGSIKIIGPNERVDNNYTVVPGLPVSINTPNGLYFYRLQLNNIGTFYATNKLGRIYGTSSNSVVKFNLDTILNADKITGEQPELEDNEYACSYEVGASCQGTDSEGKPIIVTPNDCVDDSGNRIDWETCKQTMCDEGSSPNYCVETSSNGYCVCKNQYYKESECTCYGTSKEDRERALNEVGCPTSGKGAKECEANHNCCPFCSIVCIGSCIFNTYEDADGSSKGESMLSFRTINDAEPNPNGRQLGANWDSKDYGNNTWSSGSVTNVLVAQKAGITLNEIQSSARIEDIEKVTDIDSMQKAELSVTLTPNMTKKIKEYNDQYENSGSYNNESLKCYDYELGYSGDNAENDCLADGFTWEKNGTSGKCLMKNIMCYSTFIDDFSNDFPDDFVTSANRPKANQTRSASSSESADNKDYQLSNWAGTSAPINFKHSGDKNNDNPYATKLQSIKNVKGYWGIYIYDSLDINGDGIPDIGPSWK